MWLYIAIGSIGFMIGLYIGRRLGIKETERNLHVLTGKAAKEFHKNTGL